MKELPGRSTDPSEVGDVPAEITAFLAAIEKSRASLTRVAYRTTRDMDEAEDIVQEAFMKAFECLHQFRGEARVETWLRTIVINTARNWVRRRRGVVLLHLEQYRQHDADFVPFEIADNRSNPEQCYAYRELETRIAASIERLGNHYAAAIRMCVLGDCSYLEASSALDLSLVTVKTRIFRGREMLRRSLQQSRRRSGPEIGYQHQESREK